MDTRLVHEVVENEERVFRSGDVSSQSLTAIFNDQSLMSQTLSSGPGSAGGGDQKRSYLNLLNKVMGR